mmetsp:Transcript_23358/g.49989  ORF Transcript_23358/g.49989 Transcript_23358/m.49989 type:complete len:208 (+) Transcript_23358:182-805(+)
MGRDADDDGGERGGRSYDYVVVGAGPAACGLLHGLLRDHDDGNGGHDDLRPRVRRRRPTASCVVESGPATVAPTYARDWPKTALADNATMPMPPVTSPRRRSATWTIGCLTSRSARGPAGGATSTPAWCAIRTSRTTFDGGRGGSGMAHWWRRRVGGCGRRCVKMAGWSSGRRVQNSWTSWGAAEGTTVGNFPLRTSRWRRAGREGG